jgi:outer membrane protein assembly factor BamD
VLLLSGCAQERYHRKDAETYYKEAQQALLDKSCFKAQQLFRNLLSDFPGSHYVDDAQYGLGQAYLCSEDYVEAVFEFERLLNEYPVSPFVDGARYQIGMCYYQQSRSIHHDQDETEKAIAEFERFVEDYPNSDLSADATNRIRDLRRKLAEKQLMIAENYLKWGDFPSTVVYVKELLLRYPDSGVGDRGRFLMGRAQHRMGSLDDALATLEDLSDEELPADLRRDVDDEANKVREAIAKRDTARSSAVRPPAAGEARTAGTAPSDGR